MHVNVENIAPEVQNASDPIGGYQGIARPMTGIASKMRAAGFQTHMTGRSRSKRQGAEPWGRRPTCSYRCASHTHGAPSLRIR